MADDAGLLVLFVGEDRTAVRAGGIDTMMTRGRDRLLVGLVGTSAVEETYIPPQLLVFESIERMAGADASFASSAGIEVDGESILLAFLWDDSADEIAIVTFLCRVECGVRAFAQTVPRRSAVAGYRAVRRSECVIRDRR
jgi:hypothetical protein